MYKWGHDKRYNDFSSYFKRIFSERVQKVSIDAGFTCPNRDGKKSVGGCTYCINESFNPSYCTPEKSVTRQIEDGIAFFNEKYKAQKYLAYFQAYSNTYAPIEVLKELYSEALKHQKVIGIVVATRPDCVNDEILEYLEELAKDYYVVIEYGIESCNDKALEFMNRGHVYAEAEEAILKTAGRGIHIGAHLVMGLAFDDYDTMLENAVKVSKLPIETLKLHQLQVLEKTMMAKQYRENPDLFTMFTLDGYLDFLVDVIERINPDVYLERFINQAPKDMIIAPKWGGVKNFEFIAKVEKGLKARDTYQGKLYK
ncbi:MAG: TIGR01212 family radical SAM protein [Marinifilaceae bacterium]